MKRIIILPLIGTALPLSSCSLATPLQKAMGQRMQSAAMGAALGAPAAPQASTGFTAFYR